MKKEFQFPIELDVNEINFGISNVGQVGTYSVYDKMYYSSKIYLKQPNINELHYRQEWMQDYKTMKYNVGYNLDLNGYDKATGIIIKTNERNVLTWYNNWINKEPNKYFAYIYDNKINEPIGEVYYYLDNDKYNIGILIQDKYRGRGFSKIGIELLCKVAKQNGISELYDTFESDRMNVIKIFENTGFKIISKWTIRKFDKEVETVTMMIKL